ncbi:MAG: hypothetical protein HQK54_08455 [Oligoflexales bacterium]|nr:hypothetical protein [Oligoflexales bacterium]
METTKSVKQKDLKFSDIKLDTIDLDLGTVLDRLNRISELKVEDFIPVSEGKITTTIKDMYGVIRNLEGNLRNYLNLNEAFKTENKELKTENEALLVENSRLKQQMKELEDSSILASDIEKKLDLTIAEKNKFNQFYKAELQKNSDLERRLHDLSDLQKRTRQERDDCYKEVVVLENKLTSKAWEKEKEALERRIVNLQAEKDKLKAEIEELKASGK